MKKNFLISIIACSLFCLFNFTCYSQKNKNDLPNNDKLHEIQYQIYKKSLKYGDYNTAIHSLYNMMEINPNDTSLKDSLAIMYYRSGKFANCILVSIDILKTNKNNAPIIEIKAISEQNLGLLKEALNDYERLNALSENVIFLYRIAFLQYKLERYGECKNTIEQLLDNPETDKQGITITMADGSQQIVPLKAVVLNIKGVVYMDMNEVEAAKIYFSEALKIFPDFILAQDNLKSLKNINN